MPGIEAAIRALSSGASTEKAVARAPASDGLAATTVELTMWSTGMALRGSMMCE